MYICDAIRGEPIDVSVAAALALIFAASDLFGERKKKDEN